MKYSSELKTLFPEDPFMSTVAVYPDVPPISLELTNRCNLKCPYCGNRNLTRKRGDIEWELLEKLVAECRGGRHNIAWLHGTGEPLLYPRLAEAVRLIRVNDAGDASFGTNGTLLSGEVVKKLLDCGLGSIYVSLDSLDTDIYKKTRGADLAAVLGNIRDMLRVVPEDFTVTIALMQSRLQPVADKQIHAFNEAFGSYKNVRLNRVENTIFPASGEDYRYKPAVRTQCTLPANFFTIVIDGRVQLCCVDQDVQCALGDVGSRGVNEIWFSSENQERFMKLLIGESGCPPYCQQQCGLIVEKLENAPEAVRSARRLNRLLMNAVSFFRNKRSRAAAGILNMMLEIQPNHAEALNILGVIHLEGHDSEKALGLFERAIESDNGKPSYFFNCAMAFESLENPGEAIRHYEQALALDPGYREAYERLIINLRKQKQQNNIIANAR